MQSIGGTMGAVDLFNYSIVPFCMANSSTWLGHQSGINQTTGGYTELVCMHHLRSSPLNSQIKVSGLHADCWGWSGIYGLRRSCLSWPSGDWRRTWPRRCSSCSWEWSGQAWPKRWSPSARSWGSQMPAGSWWRRVMSKRP